MICCSISAMQQLNTFRYLLEDIDNQQLVYLKNSMFYCWHVVEFFSAKEQNVLHQLAFQRFWCSGLFPWARPCAAWCQVRYSVALLTSPLTSVVWINHYYRKHSFPSFLVAPLFPPHTLQHKNYFSPQCHVSLLTKLAQGYQPGGSYTLSLKCLYLSPEVNIPKSLGHWLFGRKRIITTRWCSG